MKKSNATSKQLHTECSRITNSTSNLFDWNYNFTINNAKEL